VWYDDQSVPHNLCVDGMGYTVKVGEDNVGGTIIPGSNEWKLENVGDLYNYFRLSNKATGKYVIHHDTGIYTADGDGVYEVLQYTHTERPDQTPVRRLADNPTFPNSFWLLVGPMPAGLLGDYPTWPDLTIFGFIF